jgi:hypothetical protein
MRNLVKRTIGATSVAVVAVLLFATVAFAAYSLFGDAQVVQPGYNSAKAVQLRSDAAIAPGYGGIDLDVPAGTTFASLTTLSTDYNVTDDDCNAGSPRFQINVDTGSGIKNIFAYIGPEPSYTGCLPNTWVNSTDLLETPHFVDTAQLPGGTFYDTYADALTKYGSYPVVGIQLVVDSSFAFADAEQTILVDNVMVNTTTYTFDQPTNKEECKNNGWKTLTRADGSSFKNQGDCIQYVNTGK